MIYKKFKNLELSLLGLGAMRLPIVDGDYSNIDLDKTHEMVDLALKKGINYFDTAWMYHSGKSEEAIGSILKKYPRDSFFLASKFPGFDQKSFETAKEIFEKQLAKCQVEYFDFYLFHNVCEHNINDYLENNHGVIDYFLSQKKHGRIRHLGFSTHGSLETMRKFLEKYGEHLEFCQIQLNYLDYEFQNAKDKIQLIEEFNIPVWVMEPVRGGRLAKLTGEYTDKLKAYRDETAAAWAFRFLQSIDSVNMVLSGMSNLEQLTENIQVFSEMKPLDKEEMATLLAIADDMIKKVIVSCTNCRYCTEKCPKGLPIPDIIELYNDYILAGGGANVPQKLSELSKDKWPSECIGCKACERTCPQSIKISEMMHEFSQRIK